MVNGKEAHLFNSEHGIIRDIILMHEDVKRLDREKVQVGKDQEKAQSEKDSHSKNQGGKNPN